MKIVGIVQARMGSTRLPGKVLKKVNGIPLLQYQLERMRQAKLLDELVIATTSTSDAIFKFCKENNVQYFLGSENDVLDRYYQTAKNYGADIVVRMTSDCPVIDPNIIDCIIEYFLNNDFDYVSNTIKRTFPRGMDTEVLTMDALKHAYNKAQKEYEREHVTPYIYLNSNQFKIGHYFGKIDNSHIRLTVDTKEDFELISLIISELYEKDNNFTLEHILKMLEAEPELLKINAHIEQKKLGE